MNNITLTGRLTSDPELRSVARDKSVCRIRLAIDNGQYDTDYVDVACFGAGGEAAQKHLGKGDLIAVDGRLSYSEWTTEAGEKRSKHEVIGRVEFLSTKRSGANSDQAAEAVAAGSGNGEDVPF